MVRLYGILYRMKLGLLLLLENLLKRIYLECIAFSFALDFDKFLCIFQYLVYSIIRYIVLFVNSQSPNFLCDLHSAFPGNSLLPPSTGKHPVILSLFRHWSISSACFSILRFLYYLLQFHSQCCLSYIHTFSLLLYLTLRLLPPAASHDAICICSPLLLWCRY